MILARVLPKDCGEIDSASVVPMNLIEPTAGGISMLISDVLRNIHHHLIGKDDCF
jgi:hypothetical protein